ncbi:hypothetical protein HOY82DRAFT_551529 [Tuber indicum]|nr:hypothetical protein HOY82DRAFT_551529 [Tuber indicum]
MALEPPLNEDDIPCARAEYPPQVDFVEYLGQVSDVDRPHGYARSHGCSTLLNYEPVFLFNDTFEIFHAPRSSRLQYRPIASITAAFGHLSNPTLTIYPTYTDSRRIPQFIPFSREEKAAGTTSGCYLTVFNSVVQVPGKEFGVVWFMKMKDCRNEGGGADVFCGVGVAEVGIDGQGSPECDRKGELVFDEFGPRWGDISTVIHEGYIYLYGSGTPTVCANDGTCNDPIYQASRPTTTGASGYDVPVYLCRVPYRNRAYWHAENYKYWNGHDFISFPQASRPSVESSYYRRGIFIPPSPPEFKCVMKNIQSGTVMHARLFTERGHFIFIGRELCSGGSDKKEAMVKMRLADEPMGPWFGEASLFDLNQADGGSKGVKFGVHAHSWASNLGNGEIIVSWTEPWPGGVEMAKVKLVMQRSPPPNVIVSTTATATTAVAQRSRHHRKNARVAFDDYFDEEPIPDDPEPEHEPEPEPKEEEEEEEEEVDQEQKLCKREKARNKALAKLSGEYRREEDSDSETQSVFDFKAVFRNLGAPRSASPSSLLQGEDTPEGNSPPLAVRPYSGYDQRIIVPGDITGSWVLGERNRDRTDDTFDNRDSQDQKIANLKREPKAVANSDKRINSSTNPLPLTNNQSSSINNSDTNTEHLTSISPTTSSPITAPTSSPRHYPPSGEGAYQNAHPYPPSCASPPLPDIEAAMANHPLSVFDTHSSSQTSTGVRKKHRAKKFPWGGKKTQEEAQVEEVVGDGNEKKGWKNSLKRSAIAKFLMGGD